MALKEFKHMRAVVIGIGVAAVVLVGAILVLLLSAPKTSNPFKDIKNPNHLTDPSPLTSQQVADEYQSRPEAKPATMEMIDTAVSTYANRGDLAGLDQFLAEQQTVYKNMEGDEGQSMESWSSKVELLRADLAKAMNITKDEQPKVTWTQFTNPEILAAALAYSPISAKIDAFEDASALILPAEKSGTTINIKKVEPENPEKMLKQVNDSSFVGFCDVVLYDMKLHNYDCRVVLACDNHGYFRPWTISSLDGLLGTEWTRKELQNAQQYLDLWITLDDIMYLSDKNEAEVEKMKEEHPDWFDASGRFIAGLSKPSPTPTAPTITPTPVVTHTVDPAASTAPVAPEQQTIVRTFEVPVNDPNMIPATYNGLPRIGLEWKENGFVEGSSIPSGYIATATYGTQTSSVLPDKQADKPVDLPVDPDPVVAAASAGPARPIEVIPIDSILPAI